MSVPRNLQTVLGPAPIGAFVGPVLAHEHLRANLSHPPNSPGEGEDATAVLDDEDSVAGELAELRHTHELDLVVELTCRGMGRDAAMLARISQRSGVGVVAATGYYYKPFHPAEVHGADISELTERLLGDIDGGMDGTDVHPGVIGEVGSHTDQPSPAEERCLRAAARAALHSGLPVATHAQLGRGGPAQLATLTSEGLPPHRVNIGHQDLLDDPERHRRLAARGAYVAFDTVGKHRYQSDEVRLRLALTLLDAGHADRLLLSNDISRAGYLRRHGGAGYQHLFTSFLPRLRAAGVDEDTLRLLLHDNPLRFLSGDDASTSDAA